jgi:quercetin dioxygenase-like cupin family protein
MAKAHVVRAAEGETLELGIATMRILAAGEVTGDGFALSVFSGKEGAWTVPHVHNHMDESFYILSGRFTFTVAGEPVTLGPGDYVLVPKGASHVFQADEAGSLLCLMAPGGLENMFRELASLPADAITNPEVRAAISARHDSTPVVQ